MTKFERQIQFLTILHDELLLKGFEEMGSYNPFPNFEYQNGDFGIHVCLGYKVYIIVFNPDYRVSATICYREQGSINRILNEIDRFMKEQLPHE